MAKQSLLSRHNGDAPTIVVVRHGATELNGETDTSAERFRGWKDVPLDDEGREEGKELAATLPKTFPNITAVFSSDLVRATDTAKMIADAVGLSIRKSSGFRPWDLGQLAGKSVKDNIDTLKQYVDQPTRPIPGGESFRKFETRIGTAMHGLMDYASDQDGQIVLVTHTRDHQWIKAWAKNGFPDDYTGDPKVMDDYSNETEPGQWMVMFQHGKQWHVRPAEGPKESSEDDK